MRAIAQADNEVWINTSADANDLTPLAIEGVMGMGDGHRFQRELRKRGSVLRGSPSCMIGERRHLPNWPSNQNGKRSLNQTALDSDRDAHAKMRSDTYIT